MPLRLFATQINPVVGDIAGNAAKVAASYARAIGKADLVICPELVLSGYPPEDLVLKPAFLDAIEDAVEKLCAMTKGKGLPGLVLSTPWRLAGALKSTVLLIDNGAITATRAKYHLPNYSVFDEMRVFRPGPLPDPALFRGYSLGLATCEDIWFDDVTSHLKARGAQMIISPNGSPFQEGKTDTRLEIVRARVAETALPLLYLNQVGGQDELVFDGASFALNPDGQMVLRMKEFETDEAVFRFDDGAFTSDHREDWLEGPAAIYEALKLGLYDYVTKNGFKSVLLGLSGGVDSALVAAVAVDALGAEKVSCVMMPSAYTAQISLDDAKALADNFGCAYSIIPIAPAMEAFASMLGDTAHVGVTPENIQSRARGLTLMALSNASGAMVISTGNKSEMAVGYATLYGDMCGGFALLKDLYKHEVYALCRWRNRDTEVIPERILTRAPSAELRPDQTDQDSLPPYDVLDDILEGLIEYELRFDELVARGHDIATISRVALMLDRAEYKRRQAAPGVKITSRAFGRDRRYPITNGFSGNKS